MRTVAWLINELRLFPPEALCFAYEGEISGLVIQRERGGEQGVIHCSEGDDEGMATLTLGEKED